MRLPVILLALILGLLFSPCTEAQNRRDRAQAAIATLGSAEASARDRAAAAERIGELGAWDGVPALITALDDPEAVVRRAAANALYPLREHAEAARQPLRDRLTDPDLGVVYGATRTLAALNEPSAAMESAHRRLLAEGTAFQRFNTAGALADELPPSEVVVHVLFALDATKDTNNSALFRSAAEFLTTLAKVKGAAIAPQLAEATGQFHPRFLDAVGKAIHELKQPLPEAIPNLIAALDQEWPPSAGLLRGLGRQGILAREAVPALQRRFLNTDDDLVARNLIQALDQIARDLRVLGDRNGPHARNQALTIEIWEFLRPHARQNRHANVRSAILNFGGRLVSPSGEVLVLPELTYAARHDGAALNRLKSVQELGRLGTAARSALPELEAILDQDADVRVRDAARSAIIRIEGG